MWGPDPTVLGLAREVGCVRGQALPCMERQDWAGGFSQKEKDTWGHFGEFPFSSSSSLLSTQLPAQHSYGGVGGSKPKSEAPGRVHTSGEGCETTGTEKRVRITEGLEHAPISWRRVSAWTCGSRGQLESWARGCPSAGWEWRRAGLGRLSWLQPKRTAKLAWPVWSQQACLFVCFSF